MFQTFFSLLNFELILMIISYLTARKLLFNKNMGKYDRIELVTATFLSLNCLIFLGSVISAVFNR